MLALASPQRTRCLCEGMPQRQLTLDGKTASKSVRESVFIPPGRPGRPSTSTGGKECAVCGNCYEKIKLHCWHTFTFQDKSLDHLKEAGATEFWTEWHPEVLGRIRNTGTLPLPCTSMGPSSSQRCAAQIDKQRKIALSYYCCLMLHDIQESDGLAVLGLAWLQS